MFNSIRISALAIVLFASTAAFAIKPAAQQPSGALVDLNTSHVTVAGGGHYRLSAARLSRLREGNSGGDSGNGGAGESQDSGEDGEHVSTSSLESAQ